MPHSPGIMLRLIHSPLLEQSTHHTVTAHSQSSCAIRATRFCWRESVRLGGVLLDQHRLDILNQQLRAVPGCMLSHDTGSNTVVVWRVLTNPCAVMHTSDTGKPLRKQ